MRIFTVSDLHVDYAENRRWVDQLSKIDFKEDILILSGDVTDIPSLFVETLEKISKRFKKVHFVPGNHDLWVKRSGEGSSLEKFNAMQVVLKEMNVETTNKEYDKFSIIPLLAWYDFSFGSPLEKLLNAWTDFSACNWPSGFDEKNITEFFLSKNVTTNINKKKPVISFSHFLPRIDVMPSFIPFERQYIYPVLGSNSLDHFVRQVGSSIHIYGHSHVNQDVVIDGIRYINNAFAYPHEERISGKKLKCVVEY